MQDGPRQRLIDHALPLFVEEGYDAVSVEKLRKAAGVSNGSFFHSFATKAELAAALLVACIGDYHAAILHVLSDRPPAADGVASIVRAHMSWVRHNRSKAQFMLDEARSAWLADAAQPIRSENAMFAAAIEDWRAPLVARGALYAMPIEVFLAQLIGPANLLCRMWLTGRLPRSLSRFEKDLVAAAQRALVPDFKEASP